MQQCSSGGKKRPARLTLRHGQHTVAEFFRVGGLQRVLSRAAGTRSVSVHTHVQSRHVIDVIVITRRHVGRYTSV